jgi:hypothetical protein
MTDESDILGRPPKRKPPVESDGLDGPSFEELCRPLSAKFITKARQALTSELGARLQQRRSIKVPKVRNKW